MGKRSSKAAKGESCGCMVWAQVDGKARGEAKHDAFVIEPEGKKHALYFYEPDGQHRPAAARCRPCEGATPFSARSSIASVPSARRIARSWRGFVSSSRR